MKANLILIFYGGPDQLMPITSGLTAIFAFLLIFWNKVLGIVGKFLNMFRAQKPESPKINGNQLPVEKPAHETIEQSHP